MVHSLAATAVSRAALRRPTLSVSRPSHRRQKRKREQTQLWLLLLEKTRFQLCERRYRGPAASDAFGSTFGRNLPLVGDQLGKASDFIGEFRDLKGTDVFIEALEIIGKQTGRKPSAWLVGSDAGGHQHEECWRGVRLDQVLVNSVAADAAGVVVSASRDLRVRRWDAETGSLIEALPRAHQKSVKSIATTAAGDRLLTGAYDGTAVLWRYSERGWSWKRLLHHGKPGVPASGFGAGATDGLAFTAGWDGSLAWWHLDGAAAGAVSLVGRG